MIRSSVGCALIIPMIIMQRWPTLVTGVVLDARVECGPMGGSGTIQRHTRRAAGWWPSSGESSWRTCSQPETVMEGGRDRDQAMVRVREAQQRVRSAVRGRWWPSVGSWPPMSGRSSAMRRRPRCRSGSASRSGGQCPRACSARAGAEGAGSSGTARMGSAAAGRRGSWCLVLLRVGFCRLVAGGSPPADSPVWSQP